MNDRIKLKITSSGDYLILHTYSRAHELSHGFYVHRSKFDELEKSGYVVALDQPSILTMRRDDAAGTVTFLFEWLNRSGNDALIGREESVKVSEDALMVFIRQSAEPDGPEKWTALAIPEKQRPHIILKSGKNLKAVIGNAAIYRKFRKVLLTHFCWPRSDEIIIYDDSMPYSFGFTEIRNGERGICGGIILHNYRDDPAAAYYGIHT